jgi:hypothetical protein
VDPKHESEPNHHVPSKSCDSWIPYASTGNYIELTLGDSAPVRLSDDNYQFKIVEFPDGDGRQGHPSWEKGLEANGKYVLYFKKDGNGRGGFSILKYDEKKMGQVGYILASVLVSAGVVVGMVLMNLGPIG